VLEVEIDAAPLLLVTSLRSRRASEDGGREDIGLEFAADQHTSRSDLALALFNTSRSGSEHRTGTDAPQTSHGSVTESASALASIFAGSNRTGVLHSRQATCVT